MQPLQICIGPTIRIGRESWCLLYAGFFLFFSSGDCRIWTSLQSSHKGHHQEIACYGAGYGPLQSSHQGVHQEIEGYGPLQSSHQGDRVLKDL